MDEAAFRGTEVKFPLLCSTSETALPQTLLNTGKQSGLTASAWEPPSTCSATAKSQ